MNKVVTFGDFVREHTAAVCALAGLIILILGLLLYRMYVNGKKLAAALEEAKREKLLEIQELFCGDHSKPYPKSFSFGILEVEQDHGEIDIMELLEQADATMYEQKKEHKKQSLS